MLTILSYILALKDAFCLVSIYLVQLISFAQLLKLCQASCNQHISIVNSRQILSYVVYFQVTTMLIVFLVNVINNKQLRCVVVARKLLKNIPYYYINVSGAICNIGPACFRDLTLQNPACTPSYALLNAVLALSIQLEYCAKLAVLLLCKLYYYLYLAYSAKTAQNINLLLLRLRLLKKKRLLNHCYLYQLVNKKSCFQDSIKLKVNAVDSKIYLLFSYVCIRTQISNTNILYQQYCLYMPVSASALLVTLYTITQPLLFL